MLKTSLACAALLALGAACTGSNKTCPSDELRPDQRMGQAEDQQGTSETVIPGDPSQEQTIILIPVPADQMPDAGEAPDGAAPNEGNPEDVVPGEPQSGDEQAPTILLVPVDPEGQHPDMPQDGGGGLQEDVVPGAPGEATSETVVPREAPGAESEATPAPDPKTIYF